jgi:hypothetical protein
MKNVFKILAREEGVKTDNLRKLLSPLGEVEIILDVEGDIEGHTGMTGRWRNSTTAWDILFKDLEEEYTWIIEDDVVFNKETIKSILNEFKFEEADLISNWISPRRLCVCWGWWSIFDIGLPRKDHWRSLNCFCRVSPSLIRKVKEFRVSRKGNLFHEISLPSLAETRIDFREKSFAGYFELNNYNWKKEVVQLDNIQEYKVYHPVKSDEKHTEICNYE